MLVQVEVKNAAKDAAKVRQRCGSKHAATARHNILAKSRGKNKKAQVCTWAFEFWWVVQDSNLRPKD
jgi:hypothetical protein